MTETTLTVSGEHSSEQTPGHALTVSVDDTAKNDWTGILTQFEDATIFQTWEYEAVRWAERRISHIVLKNSGRPAAAAQVRVVQMPLLKCGVAYVYSGPLWRRRGTPPDYETLRAVFSALKTEYAIRRGLLLRLVPNEIERNDGMVRQALSETGFHRLARVKPYRSFLVNLDRKEDEILARFKPRCRTKLRAAMKKNFEIEIGNTDALFQEFVRVYRLMRQRKQFEEHIDVLDFARVQSQLPEPLKMRVVVCRYDSRLTAAAVCSTVGCKANLLLLATSNLALKLNASLLAVWHAMLDLRGRGVRFLDMGGVDPEQNPGGYMFKSYFGGEEVFHVGAYDVCHSPVSSLMTHGGEKVRRAVQKTAWLAQKILPARPAALAPSGDDDEP